MYTGATIRIEFILIFKGATFARNAADWLFCFPQFHIFFLLLIYLFWILWTDIFFFFELCKINSTEFQTFLRHIFVYNNIIKYFLFLKFFFLLLIKNIFFLYFSFSFNTNLFCFFLFFLIFYFLFLFFFSFFFFFSYKNVQFIFKNFILLLLLLVLLLHIFPIFFFRISFY